ncbi:hypothetical protein RZS08_43990, partial [Arthrospira platensis SPKY1]|nr:hypothetical protein [Arthrospira platensis SPKY1]
SSSRIPHGVVSNPRPAGGFCMRAPQIERREKLGNKSPTASLLSARGRDKPQRYDGWDSLPRPLT